LLVVLTYFLISYVFENTENRTILIAEAVLILTFKISLANYQFKKFYLTLKF